MRGCAGQLRTQLFNWFGMMVEITSVANFQVFGLPVEEDAESLVSCFAF